MDNLNDKMEMLKKISTINAVTGFDPTPFTIEFMDCESGETRRRIPVNTQLAWFRLLYPKGRIAVTTKRVNGSNAYEATARVYMDYKDEPDQFLAEGTAQRTQSEKMSEYSIIEWAQTAAIGVALRNAGFGLQFAVIGDGTGMLEDANSDSDKQTETSTEEKPKTRKRRMKSAEEPTVEVSETVEETKDDVEDTTSAGEENAYQRELERAMQLPVPLSRYAGKTLGDLILEDPKTLSYLANNTRYDGEVKAGAQLLCEYAKKCSSVA